MLHFLLFNLLTLKVISAINDRPLASYVMMGSDGECRSDRDCRIPLLHCSDAGVCTCIQNGTNLVFKQEKYYRRRINAYCEFYPCTPNKNFGDNGCQPQNAECVPNQNKKYGGENFCKCPEGTVGASIDRYPLVDDFMCVDVQLSTVHEPCWMDKLGRKIKRLSKNISYPVSVCDNKKRLECDENYMCNCHKDFKFDHSKNLCIRKAGGFKNRCHSSEECRGEMVCKDQRNEECYKELDCRYRCHCPPDCESLYVIEDNICVCPVFGSIFRNILLSGLVLCIVFIMVLGCAYYIDKKRRSSEIINQNCSLQPGPLYPNSPKHDEISADIHAASAPVLYTESPLPIFSSQIADGLPTYDEATQTNIEKHEAIIEQKQVTE